MLFASVIGNDEGNEGYLPNVRPVGEDVLIEFSPCYFADPCLDALDAAIEFLTGVALPGCVDSGSGAQRTSC